jgi:hypothetical protein
MTVNMVFRALLIAITLLYYVHGTFLVNEPSIERD